MTGSAQLAVHPDDNLDIGFDGMNLSQEERDKLEVQSLLDSISFSFNDVEFPEDLIDDEFRLARQPVENHRHEKEDRSHSKSSMENFAADVITAEDFDEGPERMAFEAIFEHSRNCFNKKTSRSKRISSLTWIFVPNTGDIPYDLCCEAVGVRANLLRVRIQYELFQKWIVLSEPIHFLMEPLPSTFEAEIMYNYTEDYLKVAKKIWQHPSIQTDRIFAFCHEHKIKDPMRILEKLSETGSVANQMDYWYFTGRNPQDMNLNKRNYFRWSSLSLV